MHTLGGDDFAFLARLLRRRSGLVLTSDKAAQFGRRLAPVLRRFGFKDMFQLIQQLRLGQESLAAAVTETMTVNETSFFRDGTQFEQLRASVLPDLLTARAKEKRLRIWSAAAAAGQEAYSIAMLLDEMGLQGWTIDLIATDISVQAIERARAGHYSPFELQRGLNPERLMRYFSSCADGGFTIAEGLRRQVTFRQFNLLDSFGWLDDLDLVLCRNVLIYFDRSTKLSVLERMADSMREGGLLLLGKAESLPGPIRAFRELPECDGLYIKTKIATPRLRQAV